MAKYGKRNPENRKSNRNKYLSENKEKRIKNSEDTKYNKYKIRPTYYTENVEDEYSENIN